MPGNLSRDPQIQPQVIPDKIAEAEQGVNNQAKTYNLKVPDIFSMISNSQMEIGSEDRDLIKRMVQNLPTDKGNWMLRVQKINEFTQTANKPVETKDLRTAISALMFLNLLKKLSFFVAQPGKLFEYVLAPIIGTDAKVMGSVDKQIIDVTKESQGEIWNYSLKMFTGQDSSFLVKGSLANLKQTVMKYDKPITYIIAAANANEGKLEFAELLISTEEIHFEGWQRIKTLNQGVILVKDNTVGILVISESEYKRQHIQYTAPEKQKSLQQKLIGFYDGPVEISVAEKNLKKLNDGIQYLESITPEQQTDFFNKKDQNFLEIIKNVVIEFGKTVSKKDRISPSSLIYGFTKLPASESVKALKGILISAKKHSDSLSSAIQKAKEATIQTESILQDQEEDKKTQKQSEVTQFSIPLKGCWSLIPNKIILNLGDAKEYNQQQLTIASDLAKNIENTFNAFQELNTNLINFFATSKQKAQSGNYGNKAIQNADTISSNIASFQEKEKAEQEPK